MAPFRVRYNGVEIEVETTEELVRLLEELGVHPLAMPFIGGSRPATQWDQRIAQLRLFLHVLETAGGRVTSREVAERVGLTSARALPGAMRTWRKILEDLDLDLQDVAVNERDGMGVNQWSAGPSAALALKKLSEPDQSS